MSSKSIEPSPHYNPRAFASAFVSTAGRAGILGMAMGGGAFVIAELCERLRGGEQHADDDEETKALRAEVKGWFGKGEIAKIEASEAKGKNVLLEKLAALAPDV